MRVLSWLIIFPVKIVIYSLTVLFIVADILLIRWLIAVSELGIAAVLICWLLFMLWALWYFWEYHFLLIVTVLLANVQAAVILWQYFDLVVWILGE